jgi:hypothetical protein
MAIPGEMGNHVNVRKRVSFGVRSELLQHAGVAADCSELLVQFLKESPPQELAHIRPLALAKRLGVPADRLTLHGARTLCYRQTS